LPTIPKSKDPGYEVELLPEERRDAEEDIIRLAQQEVFQDEYKALAEKKPIAQKSALVKFNPR
jgi:hypothetical protein